MPEKETRGLQGLLREIIQVGIVVPDVQVPIAGMKRIFGIEPDFVREVRYPEISYGGRTRTDAWATIASFGHFGTKIEFMQPMGEGESMWRDFVEQNGSRYALHHIRFNDVAKSADVAAALAERGIPLLLEGKSVVNPAASFAFFDSVPQVGFVSEVVSIPDTPEN